MRIAFFHNLPSGGGKRVAYEWIKRLTQAHKVDLYLYGEGAEDFLDLRPFVDRTIFIKNKMQKNGKLGRMFALHQVWQNSKQVAASINAGGYDLALVLQCKISNSPFVLKYLKIPSLYHCHEPLEKAFEPHYGIRWGSPKWAYLTWMSKLDRSNARLATLISVSSLYSREYMYRSFGVYPRLNYLGVDTEQFRKLNIQREPVILSVGALHPTKAQDFIIQSVGTLSNRPRVKFIYNFSYGASNYKDHLYQLAKDLDVELAFEHLATEDDLVKAYNQASITAFPSKLEPLGLVPLESMACGTPVVGIREAGLRETVQHGENGFLTERDPLEFGLAIQQLLSDQTLWMQMSHNGRQGVLKHWTWDESYKKLEEHMALTLSRHAI